MKKFDIRFFRVRQVTTLVDQVAEVTVEAETFDDAREAARAILDGEAASLPWEDVGTRPLECAPDIAEIRESDAAD